MDTLKKEIAVLMQCIDFKEIEKQLQANSHKLYV